METIARILGFEQEDMYTGQFGVEIEVEGKNLHPVVDNGWKTVDDGSLRGNFPRERSEYVFTQPLNFREAVKAIEYLAKQQEINKATLDFSFRTSVHVHLNTLQYTEDQLFNLIYVYYLLEKPIIKLCGDHRIGNRFCLRLCDGEGIYDILLSLVSNGVKSINRYSGDEIRYSALNLDALNKYGSVEFRGMKGTLDVTILKGWLGLLHNLGEYAKKQKNIIDIHNQFTELSVEAFIKQVVGKEYYELMNYSGMHDDVEYGYSLTIDLPHTYKLYKGKK